MGITCTKRRSKLFPYDISLVDNNKIVNAFAIYNLKSNRYVQLNDQGTEIISGTVEFSSKGLKKRLYQILKLLLVLQD